MNKKQFKKYKLGIMWRLICIIWFIIAVFLISNYLGYFEVIFVDDNILSKFLHFVFWGIPAIYFLVLLEEYFLKRNKYEKDSKIQEKYKKKREKASRSWAIVFLIMPFIIIGVVYYLFKCVLGGECSFQYVAETFVLLMFLFAFNIAILISYLLK